MKTRNIRAIKSSHPKEKGIKEGLYLRQCPLTIFEASIISLSKYTTSSKAESSSKQLCFKNYQIALSNKLRNLSLNEAWHMLNRTKQAEDRVP
jgi:hypothetical protein